VVARSGATFTFSPLWNRNSSPPISISCTSSSLVVPPMRPPSRRGSTKLRRPTRAMVRGLSAATSWRIWLIAPYGML
jgi:hypothetical protein